jgi:menaquinone-9 beta-reductase
MRLQNPLIIGGGPAGSAAAIMLARGGAKPLILERSRETGDALCGGFLSWRTLDSLAALGLDREVLAGHAVAELRLFAGPARAVARLPGPAIGLSRRRMDSLLLDQARHAGARIERGVSVRDYAGKGCANLADGAQMHADSLFLACGKYDLRGLGRPREEGDITLGLRLKLPASPALACLAGGAIELHLFDRGYCGLVLQEDGSGNLCMAVRKTRLGQAGGDPRKLFDQLAKESPAFGERMACAQSGSDIDAISAVPYGWITAETEAGLFRLGDQAAVIPSLAGEGNGIALASGRLAAEAWLNGGADGAAAFQAYFARQARRPVGLATRLWHLAEKPALARFGARLAALAPVIAGHLAGQTRIRS